MFSKKNLHFVRCKSILLQRDIAPLRDIPLPSLGVSSLDLAALLGGPFFARSPRADQTLNGCHQKQDRTSRKSCVQKSAIRLQALFLAVKR